MLRQAPPPMGQGVLIIETSRSHLDTPHSIWHPWTSDQPHVETSTWQHTTFKSDILVPGRIRTRNPSMLAAAGIGFKNICQTKTRITQNCIYVPLIQSVSCYRFSGRLISYMPFHTSVFSLLHYRTMVCTCWRSKWGLKNIAAVFRNIPKAHWSFRVCLCSNLCIANTGLFKMIVEVLTTCHTQYTWDRSICVFFI